MPATREQTTATVTVGVAAPNGSFVHLQYRTGTDAWRTAKKAVIAEETEAVFALRGLTSDREYEVQASYDSSFPDTDVTLSTTFTTLPPSVYSVIVRDKTTTTANAKIKIAAPNGDSQTVRLRYSPTAAESWTTAQPATSTDADASIPLSSLTAATQYKVEATLASDFTSGVRPTVFSTLGDDPIVEDVFVYEADINKEDATATIIVANAGGDAHEVHLRYRTAGETPGAWSTEDLKADTDPNNSDAATIELTPLTAGTQYDVQASLDSTFTIGTQQTTFTTDGPVPEIVSIVATSDSSTEATVTVTIEHPSGSTVYVGYRTTGNTPGLWSAPVDFAADTSRHSLTLSGLSPSTEYEVTAAFSTPFPVTPIVSDTFSTLAFEPTLTDVSVMDITQSGSGGAVKATVTVTILDAESQIQTVFVRYREHGTAAWSDPPLELSGTETATRDITTFMVSTSYDLQASLSSDFGRPVEATFSTPDVIEVMVKDVTDESAKAVVTIGEPGTAQKTVHLRYGPVSDDPVGTVTKAGSGGTTTKDTAGLGATETHTAMGQTPGDTAEIPVANLLPDQEYVLEASLDDGFTRGVERITFRTEPADPDGTGGRRNRRNRRNRRRWRGAVAEAEAEAVAAAAAAVQRPSRSHPTPISRGTSPATSTHCTATTPSPQESGETVSSSGSCRILPPARTPSSSTTLKPASAWRTASSNSTSETASPTASGPTAKRCGSPIAAATCSSPTTSTPANVRPSSISNSTRTTVTRATSGPTVK